MEDLIRKYFDGELNDQEALEFMTALENQPELAARVQHTEEMLGLADSLPMPQPTENFCSQVMSRVSVLDGAGFSTPPRFDMWKVWSRPLPLAASWILALGLGYFAARGLPANELNAPPLAQNSQQTLQPTAATFTTADPATSLKIVRFVYMPQDSSTEEVGVAGTFNGWSPKRSPMHLENGYWTTNLLLPVGNYDYMFVINNTAWVTDPIASTTRDDGFGRRNAVLELGI